MASLSSTKPIMSQKVSKSFLSELRLISIDFNNFWHKDSQNVMTAYNYFPPQLICVNARW